VNKATDGHGGARMNAEIDAQGTGQRKGEAESRAGAARKAEGRSSSLRPPNFTIRLIPDP
jgi:hypothetical protein